MKQADQVLDDEELLDSVYEAQGRRRPKSRSRGRKQTPAEVTLRLAVLKHVRDWSFEETEREVRANVVYRQFTRIGAEKVPDAKTLGRLASTKMSEQRKKCSTSRAAGWPPWRVLHPFLGFHPLLKSDCLVCLAPIIEEK